MKRKIVNFTWDDEDAQAAFAEWCPFPDDSVTSEDVDRIERLVGIAPPLRVLDVGCGNGRHSIELARRGYGVVGIDDAKRFLAEAREKVGPRKKRFVPSYLSFDPATALHQRPHTNSMQPLMRLVAESKSGVILGQILFSAALSFLWSGGGIPFSACIQTYRDGGI